MVENVGEKDDVERACLERKGPPIELGNGDEGLLPDLNLEALNAQVRPEDRNPMAHGPIPTSDVQDTGILGQDLGKVTGELPHSPIIHKPAVDVVEEHHFRANPNTLRKKLDNIV
jgi:hypothetical protein